MDVITGIDKGKTSLRRRAFDLFRPVSVRSNGQRLESPNWCVRFQHQGKRTCRSLGTADYRLAQQRAKLLVASVRQNGWASAIPLPTSHGSLSLDDLLEQYHRQAVSRGLRPRSIADASFCLKRIAQELGAQKVSDLTPEKLQGWIQAGHLKPVTLRAILNNAGSVFGRASVLSMGMPELSNPFVRLIRPKIDREPFHAPTRQWILELMHQGIRELEGAVRLAFVLGLGAGLRWGEIISLSWEEVGKDRVTILATKAKARRAREVPVSKVVQGVLSSARGEGIVIDADAKQVHQALCNWLRKKEIKDQKPVHYLRKCFGSLAVGDHGIVVASKLLGHANITQTASTYAGQVDQLPAVKF